MIERKNSITVKLSSSRMKFSSGHFTIFSSNDRETIHGHNFSVECLISGLINTNGMIIDYGIIKNELSIICHNLDEKLLIPNKSKYLHIKKIKDNILCKFNGEKMSFPCRDVCILPISNITIEALAKWFLGLLQIFLKKNHKDSVFSIEISVSSSPAQIGYAKWERIT